LKIIGVEFDANRACYVAVEGEDAEDVAMVSWGTVRLEETRDAPAARSFAGEVARILATVSPTVVAIKAKPENGQMRAGAAALKMEAILLAEAPCEVVFLSPQRLKPIQDRDGLYAYLQGAWKAAVGGFDPPAKKKPSSRTGKA